MKAIEVFAQSNGELTKRYYVELEKRGSLGLIAVNLFRAQKTSTRAKLYRGRRYKDAAYDTKTWSMQNLVKILADRWPELWRENIESGADRPTYGWKEDPETLFGERASWVLYVDLPQGQVSFHSPTRLDGPDYVGEWDGQRKSAERILAFCDSVYAGAEVAA